MAGKVQHEIPQLFQRGFLIPGTSDAERIFVFRKGGASFPSNINRSGAQSYFYSEPSADGSATLDDEITDYEGRLGGLVQTLRSVPVDGTADSEIAAEVIAHLTTRNAHLRGAFSHGITSFAEGARLAFSDEDNVRRLVGLNGPEVTDIFREHLAKAVAKEPFMAALGIPATILEKLAFAAIREGFSPFFAEQLPSIEGMLGLLSGSAEETARDSHRQALSKSTAPDVRVAMLSSFHWQVAAAVADLILPDCVALAIEENGDTHPLMMASPKDIEIVLLPLTSHTLLIGRRDHDAEVDPSSFNSSAAECSHTYFLCASHEPEPANLISLIGQRSVTIIDNAIAESVSKFLPEVPQPFEETPLPRVSFNIPVTYQGEFTESGAKVISEALSALLGEAAWTMPFDRLDGITIADDYEGALKTLDRGTLGIGAPRSRQDDKAVGVAQTPNVVRDGVVKSRIVLAGFIGRNLLSDVEDDRARAEYVVANQLAHAGFTQIFDEALPGVMLGGIDGIDGLLQRCTYPAWNAYFAGRAAAPFGGSHRFADEQYVVLTALDELYTEIPKSRMSYRWHGDMDRFLEEILPRVTFLLEHAAGLLGHADGVEQDVFEQAPQLAEELENLQLKAWCSDFRRDLAFLWDRRGRWESYTEFLALNRHAERILWTFPILPWTTPEGEGRIEVPFQEDELEKMANGQPLDGGPSEEREGEG